MTKERIVAFIPLLIFAIIAIIVTIVSQHFEGVIKEALTAGTLKIADLTSSLINIASIIFAISGAWIALVFPKSIKKLKSNQVREITSEDEEAAFYDISICSVVSLIVLFLIMMINYIITVFVAYENKSELLYYCFVVVTTLYFIESLVVLWTAKTTFKVFASYSIAIMNRSTLENIESVQREEDD